MLNFIIISRYCASSGLVFKKFLNTSQDVHSNHLFQILWTLLVSADYGCLVFSISYNVACVPDYSVPPYSLKPT